MNRLLNITNLTVFLLSVLTLMVVVNYFAQRPEARMRIDATKTRAYSLSQQTMNMLNDLDGPWTIALVMIQSEADRSLRRQIDEVFGRFTQAASNVSVKRIDPADPASLADYEALLADLRHRYADTVQEYEQHLAAGRTAFADVMLFVQQQSGMLQQHILLAQDAGVDEAALQEPIRRAQTLALMADKANQVLEELDKSLRIGDTQPVPDYEIARSILAHELAAAANELYETYEVLGEWVQRQEFPMDLRSFASTHRAAHEQRSRELAVTVDPLRHLPPLELTSIGRQLATGEAAVILGPNRAAVIPSRQLFPKSNIRRTGDGHVTFDQRFRGEQLIAAAMRSLLVKHMPLVVFMHVEAGSMLRQRELGADLTGISTVLHASRIEVQEWNVTNDERPSPKAGQPVVWVPLAPSRRDSIEPTRNELALINQIKRLIDDGESVLLSTYPSTLPRYGQPDPWASAGEAVGMKVDSARVVYESYRTGSDERQTLRAQLLQRFASDHPVARAVHGQQTQFPLATIVRVADDSPANVRHDVIAAIAPDENRWLEANWAADPTTLPQPTAEQRFDAPQPVVMAARRPHPIERGEQRVVLVGSGGWMLTYVADEVVSLGGGRSDRVALVYPGNHELMLASIAWLAGMDDLIAQSPTGQEVARLDEISDAASQRWFWIIVVGLPAASLAVGLLMWGVRRV